ncbi:cupredoxin domain-containing protein [Fructobacillus ficulneus]|uniref:Cupredoxin-like domain protein n=1 Tax=Fructobacillus ficulneus TaxID=157463 RepID=A0A0K8MIP4_9LACO|nr:cupredoxin domain-containing protein [Fructobacillus ficulneus]GAP00328.1 cupredoxin-like domain protein [Fructobacillus ficulneus]
MDKLIVLIAGLALIAFILWWFFGHHEVDQAEAKTVADHQAVAIEVNGGYSPERVVLQQGVPATLTFTRTDASSCLDQVVFADFGINQDLPEGQPVAIEINTDQAGDFTWACGMDMFRGQIVIK